MSEAQTDSRSDDIAARANEAALNAATEALLNCYLREGGAWHPITADRAPELARPQDRYLAVMPFPEERSHLVAGVRHLSPTHRHRFSLPVTMPLGGARPMAMSFDTLARMFVIEFAGPRSGPETGALIARMRASVRAVATFLQARDGDIDALYSAAPQSFIASEQALLLGHMVHPTPKSRSEMTAQQLVDYAPETAATFQLHWLAIAAELVEHDSATGTPAPQILERLLREDPAVDGAALDAALAALGDRVLLPAHPWEIEYLRTRDRVVAALMQDGAIVDLGPLGSPVTPTTSVRTVYNADWPYQLKFSLHVSITNSKRVTLAKELRRAVEAARLMATAIGARAAAIAPDFIQLQDPAYATVSHGGHTIDGLSVILRENRWQTGSGRDDVSAITSLCQDHPYGGRSRLGQIVAALAQRSGRVEADIACEWFARYCAIVVVPLIRLYVELGLCMEPHQQNVVLELDGGWPVRAVCRDSQGYFHRAAAHADIAALVADSTSVFAESLADQRLVYYPFVNNALAVINALGVAGAIDESLLLSDLKALLERERERGGRYPGTLLDRLLSDSTWPCKANLRTRLNEMDELVGDIELQSVYVQIFNPLHGVDSR